MNTDRRTLLGAGAALALPTWMARAFAGQDERPGAQRAVTVIPTLASAEQRARELGKPLLVILTDPPSEVIPYTAVWSEYFAHATQDAWLDLALVEVVCLTRAAFGVLDRPRGRGFLWAVLVETDGLPGGRRFVEGDLPAITSPDHDPAYVVQARARAAALAQLVHDAILYEGALTRRAAQLPISVGRMKMEDYGRREAALSPDPFVRLIDLDRFAAEVRVQGSPPRQEQLALAARVRLFEQDPPGARWKAGPEFCPACGMGHVPRTSRYFLEFYTQ